MNGGRIIAAFGIPGSGKTSTMEELANLCNCSCLHEMEEEQWGDAVKYRKQINDFTCVMWFRSNRIPLLYWAQEKKNNGETVFLDFFYDKLFSLYFDKQGIEWFYDKDDPYFEQMKEISEKDYEILPDADILIFFRIQEDCWKKFLRKRGRDMDKEVDFQNSYILQDIMLEAAKKYCSDKHCKLIIHDQSDTTPLIEAQKIYHKLENK